jgi:hypothetical protein
VFEYNKGLNFNGMMPLLVALCTTLYEANTCFGPKQVAALVHCCYLLRCHSEDDPESLLSSYAIVQAIVDAIHNQ